MVSKQCNILENDLKADSIDFVKDYIDLWNNILVIRDQE